MTLEEKQRDILGFCGFDRKGVGVMRKCINFLFTEGKINTCKYLKLVQLNKNWKTYGDSNHILLVNLLYKIINGYR